MKENRRYTPNIGLFSILGILFLSLLITGIAAASGTNETADDGDDGYPIIGAALSGMCLFVCCGILILDIILMVWVYKDAERRGEGGAKWLIIVLITGIIGLIVWLVVRPKTYAPGKGESSAPSYSPQAPGSGGSKSKGKIIIGILLLLLGIACIGLYVIELDIEPIEDYIDYLPIAGGVLALLGLVLFILGMKGGSGKKDGEAGAGNVDIANLIGGSSPPGENAQPPMPGMDPNAPPATGDQIPGMPPMIGPGQPPAGQAPGMESGGMQELPGMDGPPGGPGPGQPAPIMPPGQPQQPAMGPQPGMGMPPQQLGAPGAPPQQPAPFGVPPQGVQPPAPGQQVPPGQAPYQPQHPAGPTPPGQMPPQPGGPQAPPGMPPTPQYQPQNWNCPNCQTSVEMKYAFCTSCGYKRN